MKTRIFDKKCNACNASDAALVEIRTGDLEIQLCKTCAADLLIELLNYGYKNLSHELLHIESLSYINHEDE